MYNSYCEVFRNILRRIMADSNRERYRAICQHTCNKDEERIWQLCEHFWPKAYSDRSLNIEEYHPNNELRSLRFLREQCIDTFILIKQEGNHVSLKMQNVRWRSNHY